MNILLLEGIHPKASTQIEAQGFHVKELPHGSDLSKENQKVLGLGVRSATKLSKNVLQNLCPHLGVIGAFCIGVDQIDLASAAKLGIPVFNAPYGNTRSVAELVISYIISLSRRTYRLNHLMHQKKWEKSAKDSHEVRGKTLGIVGYGHIGTQVGILAESMGMRVLYYDIVEKLPIGNARFAGSLDELLGSSDFVTLHVPETPDTRNLINKENLRKMKPKSFLINTSRGKVVNLSDLKEALEQDHLSGTALDVFPVEPAQKQSLFSCPLQGMMDKAILSPHIAGSTEEAQQNIALQVANSLIKYLLHGVSDGALNFPPLSPPPLNPTGAYQRIINIHDNVPGVLANINNLASGLKLNIKSQYLGTNSHIGYLIMDVETRHCEPLHQGVRKLPTSIRTQVLPFRST